VFYTTSGAGTGLPNGAEIFAITVSGATVTSGTHRLSHDAICHSAELAADLALARPPRPAETHPTDPSLKEEITMSRIPRAGRHIRDLLARRTSPPGTAEPRTPQPLGQEPHQASRPGHDSSTRRFVQHVAAAATVAADQHRPTPTTTGSRQRTAIMPRLLPHTIQLCIHCRHNPAGFWVSRNGSRTARRPWCLSCCQDLDPGCYHVNPFDS
jgi:hypothetical protein